MRDRPALTDRIDSLVGLFAAGLALFSLGLVAGGQLAELPLFDWGTRGAISGTAALAGAYGGAAASCTVRAGSLCGSRFIR